MLSSYKIVTKILSDQIHYLIDESPSRPAKYMWNLLN